MDTDSDSATPTRSKRNASIPSRALDYVSKHLPSRMESASQGSTTAVVGQAGDSIARVPTGKTVPSTLGGSPTRSPIYSDDDRETKRRKKGKNKTVPNDTLLDSLYEHMESESDRTAWLLSYLQLQTGRNYQDKGLSLSDLEALWSAKNRPEIAGVNPGSSQLEPLRRTDSMTVAPGTPFALVPGATSGSRKGDRGNGRQHIGSKTSRPSLWIGGVSPVPEPRKDRFRVQAPSQQAGHSAHRTSPEHPDQPRRLGAVPPTSRQDQSKNNRQFDSVSRGVPDGPANAHRQGQLDDDEDNGHSQRAGNSGNDAPERPDDFNLGAQRQRVTESNVEDKGDLGDDEEEDETDGEPAVRRSRRGRQDNIKDRAQLRLFGNARPLVELLAERIRVRAVTENAYADITYVLPVPDHDDDQAPATTLFMVMIAEEWANVNRELRKERAPLELLAEHVTYVRTVFTQVRNAVKSTIMGFIEDKYDIGPKFSPDRVAKTVNNLLDDAFHSPNLRAPDKDQFQHPIIADSIKKTHFDNPSKCIGYRYASYFKPMPLPTVALHCTIIQFVLSAYRSGVQKMRALDMDNQKEYFEYYLDHLNDAAQQNKNRIHNMQHTTFESCYKPINAQPKPPKKGPRVYESDTDTEFVSAVPVPRLTGVPLGRQCPNMSPPQLERDSSPAAGPSNWQEVDT